MKKSILYALLLMAFLAFIGCQPAAVPAAVVTEAPALPTTVPPTDAPPTAAPAVLEVIGMTETKSLSMEDLSDLPYTEGLAGIKSSTGKITPPVKFGGILLSDLLELVGGLDSSMSVQVEAEDGYAMTLSGDQILNGDFIAYDPGTGDETTSDSPLKVMLAYEMDGKPLDEKKDGNLRLVVISEEPDQVTDGHWSVKWVTKVSLKPLVEEWVLLLQGAIIEEMDRGTFESGAAENCHKTTWQDDKAQTWTGIPLWLLVGRVDDDIKHDDDAFNDEAADKGYSVEVVAGDGYSVTFDSAKIKRNDDLIVAYLVNGNPLVEKDFPLRLVGSDVGKKESVGGIAKIIVHLDEKPSAQPTLPPQPAASPTSSSDSLAGARGLQIVGLAGATQSWTLDDLKGMELVKVTVDHPKKGQQELEGLRLNALLALAQPKSEAQKLVLSASDGYSVEIDLKAVKSCVDCLVAVSDDGLSLAMPGMESSFWVKDLAKIELK